MEQIDETKSQEDVPMVTDSDKPKLDTSENSAMDVETTKEIDAQTAYRENIRKLHKQLTQGCGQPVCNNTNCATGSGAPMLANAAAARCLELLPPGSSANPDLFCKKIFSVAELPALLADSGTSTGMNTARRAVFEIFSSQSILDISFRPQEGEDGSDIDVPALRACYNLFLTSEIQGMNLALSNALKAVLAYSKQKPVPVRNVKIALENPAIHEMQSMELPVVCEAIYYLNNDGKDELVRWWSVLDEEISRNLIDTLQTHITLRILQEIDESKRYIINYDDIIIYAAETMNLLLKATKERKENTIPNELFYNDAINQHIHLIRDFEVWKRREPYIQKRIPKRAISFCDFPFFLTLPMKAKIFSQENEIMRSLRQNQDIDLLQLIMGHQPSHFMIKVSRDSIVRDAIQQISEYHTRFPKMLKKEFKVQFEGEEGLDYGGVRKEFFLLILKELFDPKYGMFTYSEATRLYWFYRASFETPEEFRLLGMLTGIALYNNVNLDLHFPSFIFRKLMEGHGESKKESKLTLSDLAEVNPELAHGLQQLLDYDGDDLEDVFMRTFCVEYEVFGEKRIHALCEGGVDRALTKDNREEFVELYIDYELNESIKASFNAYREGFWIVCEGAAGLSLFEATELQELICGTQDLDFEALEEVTQYDGYEEGKDTQVVKWFWEIVKNDFSDDDKKQLLAFSTGSDRVPVGGLEHVKFIIGKQGPDSDRLPSSHTCFNVLLLPEYSSKEKLERLLRKAIQNSEGFGMI
eukprot:m.120033 g.120033  ORF g.120033 m.120033 type:complete len:755 (+) comp14343_c0_seq5:255-2519(+)